MCKFEFLHFLKSPLEVGQKYGEMTIFSRKATNNCNQIHFSGIMVLEKVTGLFWSSRSFLFRKFPVISPTWCSNIYRSLSVAFPFNKKSKFWQQTDFDGITAIQRFRDQTCAFSTKDQNIFVEKTSEKCRKISAAASSGPRKCLAFCSVLVGSLTQKVK